MFNLSSFSINKYTGSDGLASSFISKLLQKITHLLHSPETGVLKVNCALAAGIQKHDIVCFVPSGTAAYDCELAVTSVTPAGKENAIGVSLETILNTKTGYIRFSGEVPVNMVASLGAVANGEAVYVSAVTLGKGTTVAPVGAGTYVKRIGIVTDNTNYSNTSGGSVVILIEKETAFIN